MKHSFNASYIAFASKPNQAQSGIAHSSMEPTEMDLAELAEHVSQGKSFCLASFTGKRCIANFDSASLLAVDIDNGNYTLPQLLARAGKFKPSLIYSTFSSTAAKPKWRVCWQLEEQIFDAAKFKAMLKHLAVLYDADPACVDSARMLFGTNQGIAHFAMELLSPSLFPSALNVQSFSFATSNVSNELSETEQAELIKALPYAKRYELSLLWKKVQSNLAKPSSSRYQSIWNSARELAQLGFLADNIIAASMLKELSQHKAYDSYDKEPAEIISAGIAWGRKHCI